MSFFNAILGNASELTLEQLNQELGWMLTPGESFQKGYKLIRDLFIFTNKRLVLVDKQGMSGKKTEFMSVPYNKIVYFAVETAGSFDLDSELKIYVVGGVFFQKQFRKDIDVYSLYQVLSNYVLG